MLGLECRVVGLGFRLFRLAFRSDVYLSRYSGCKGNVLKSGTAVSINSPMELSHN